MPEQEQKPLEVAKKEKDQTETSAIASQKVEVKPAKLPKGLSPEEQRQIDEKAEQITRELETTEGMKALELADKVTTLGLKTQRHAAQQLELHQERMGVVFDFKNDGEKSTTAQVEQDIEKLEAVMERVHPKYVQREPFFRILGIIPFLGNRLVRVLKTIAKRRKTLAQFATELEETLRAGEARLVKDNVELKVSYGNLETEKALVEREVYGAEVLMEKLDALIKRTEDKEKKGQLQTLLFIVSNRAQNLHAMIHAYGQALEQIKMIRESNFLVIETIRQMATMGMNVVWIALAICAAIQHSKNAIDLVRTTREFMGNLLVANAAMLEQHMKEIGDVYKEPMIAIRKLEEAYTRLSNAKATVQRYKVEGVAAARENIAKLKAMTNQLEEDNAPVEEQDSLGFVDLPTRPVGATERPQI
ncbi:MAG: toxic anion resistance protein [Candidatus Nealsonbacteria bacterium]|nr:toxic anion resistance protein [Candidatus Nealsonbacteria bacterium]